MLRLLRQYADDRRCRRIYPQLFDDSLQSARLRGLAARFYGKTIAVVGNAQTVFDFPTGPEIDSADVVVRINEGFPCVPESQGRRTDLLCLATSTSPEQIRVGYGDPALLFVSPRRAVLSPLLAGGDSIVVLPLSDWKTVSALLQCARPSAGFMTVWIARNVFSASEVRLYGFDWKKTKTYYAEKNRRKRHNWERERETMARWADEGWLKLPPAGA